MLHAKAAPAAPAPMIKTSTGSDDMGAASDYHDVPRGANLGWRTQAWPTATKGRIIAGAMPVPQSIVGFHQDADGHWGADLACGHTQHVRHDPPLIERPWVLTPEGRARVLFTTLACKKCDDS